MIAKATKKLKSSFSPGPDGIPSAVLKRCADQLISPLLAIFNKSMQETKFPTEWKKSFMFPVFKKGPNRFIENYRGITSLCAGSKLLKIVVSDVILFNCRCYIAPEQHGFMPKRSVNTNLLEFTSFCIDNVTEGRQVDAIYTDLKAAFDRVDHDIALQKFAKLGFSQRFCRWMESYLKDRKIQVKIGASVSDEFTNGSGVAQGSNLGPLYFAAFFNDANFLFAGNCKLSYADDFKLFIPVDSLADCYVLQSRFEKFAQWCSYNRLELSADKCYAISFHRKKSRELFSFNYSLGSHILERPECVKDLGVLLDSRLDFHQQQSCAIDKANRKLGFLFKAAQEFNDPLCLRSLYCALVRSHLETSAIVWAPYSLNWIDRIERLQRKFIWYALRRLPWNDPSHLPRYEDRCNLLGLETLQNRRTISRAVFAAKLIAAETDSPNLLFQLNAGVQPRNLRATPGFFSRPLVRTVFADKSPVRSLVTAFNEFYHLFDFNEPVSRFLERLKAEFKDRARLLPS